MSAKQTVLRICCALALLFAPVFCHADTLQLISTTGGSSGGVDIYPYNFSVNGSSTLSELVCLNYNREVSVGEKWQVQVQGLDMGTSQKAIDYRADALLFSAFGKYGLSNSDVQFAIWSIFDPTVTSNGAFSSTSQQLVKLAMQYAVDPNLMASGFFQGFSLYTPTANQDGWTNGIPQEFIGTAVTPEPSGIALLGTGLLCTGLIWFRKRVEDAAPLAC